MPRGEDGTMVPAFLQNKSRCGSQRPWNCGVPRSQEKMTTMRRISSSGWIYLRAREQKLAFLVQQFGTFNLV